MTPVYPLAVKESLVQMAAALHLKDEKKARSIINEPTFSHPRSDIYHAMWEVMGKPKGDNEYGKKAFLGQIEVPLFSKIQAVERVLKDAIVQNPFKTEGHRNLPEVQVKQYYDLGFDHRYTPDGEYYSLSQGLRSRISGVFAYIFFRLNTWLTFGMKRHISQLIVKSTSTENALSSYCYKVCMKSKSGALEEISPAEQQFFNQSSDLLKALDIHANPPKRFFPSELLQPIHRMNRGETPQDRLQNPQPDSPDNRDLAYIPDWPFARLNAELCKNEDRLEYGYVPHYLFIHCTRAASENLKTACREYRQALAETVTDWKCAFSYRACIAKLTPSLSSLNEAWKAYVASHELLTEANQIYQTRDHSTPIPLTTRIGDNSLVTYFEAEKEDFEALGLKTTRFIERSRS